ncbi:sulfatase-like hydrolase/transferase [Polaribacter sp. BAL334]|uniref:sulfatase-like hydrolase/transferase n=1 Tax=Polaribacter sp. BAL334 TaxID=1708178 RepID=UPI0018D2741F|nr:sulfatase-like hydrolase/transferase [Polaribacter sp. BAL334]MBG7611220.1 sulfatase-like hydrolase/transferase [Polaribacter sp. BAL334]
MSLKTIYVSITVLIFSCNNTSKKTEHQNKPSQPNIVILLADDMGYGELGCYGQEVIKTPNIDKLASEGMRFTQFYAGSAVCAPSRGVLMTGMQVGKLNVRGNYGHVADGNWGRVALKKSEITIGEMLKDAGYQTSFIGKWHLGVPEDVSTWATGRGFDYAIQEQWGNKLEGGKFDENDHWVNKRDSVLYYDWKQYDCKDVFRTNLAIDFLDKKRDANKPLFLVMSYRTPHVHEPDLRETERYNEFGWPENERRHASRITMLDEQVQRLLDKLEEMNELDNTLVVFTSDNGPQAENHSDLFFKSAGGLKGKKRDMYEGGIRVPMIAWWKGKIKAGSISNHPGIFYDIMPTLAQIVGVESPSQTDGISFLPELMGNTQKKHEHLYWELQEGKTQEGFRTALRKGDWKVLRYQKSGNAELYNINNDVYEQQNLALEYTKRVKEMDTIMLNQSEANPHWPFSGKIKK